MPIPLPAGSADAKTHHIILEHNTQLDEQLPCCTNSPSCKLKIRSEEDNNFRYCILELAHRRASELPVLEYGIMHCARISIQLYIMYVVLVCLLEYMYLYVLVRMWHRRIAYHHTGIPTQLNLNCNHPSLKVCCLLDSPAAGLFTNEAARPIPAQPSPAQCSAAGETGGWTNEGAFSFFFSLVRWAMRFVLAV